VPLAIAKIWRALTNYKENRGNAPIALGCRG
jgi:hypothetical protein